MICLLSGYRLWSRLLLHFWALEVEREVNGDTSPDPIEYLQRAFEETIEATTSPSEWYGTTTSVTALLHSTCADGGDPKPILYVTNLGDCKVLVIRPSEEKIIFQTEEQWHWFDCPMQLGTNSIDTPRENAALSRVELAEDDIVLCFPMASLIISGNMKCRGLHWTVLRNGIRDGVGLTIPSGHRRRLWRKSAWCLWLGSC